MTNNHSRFLSWKTKSTQAILLFVPGFLISVMALVTLWNLRIGEGGEKKWRPDANIN